MLISDDFPTLDLPITANSGKTGLGHWSNFTLDFMNLADLTLEWVASGRSGVTACAAACCAWACSLSTTPLARWVPLLALEELTRLTLVENFSQYRTPVKELGAGTPSMRR